MARIVIVSNRVPIPKSRVPAAGGLTVALRDLLIPGSMWFGWSGRLASEPSGAGRGQSSRWSAGCGPCLRGGRI